MPAYSVKFLRQAEKYFLRLDHKDQERISVAIRLLAQDPYSPTLDVKPLVGQPGRYRFRVGDFRVIYCIDQGELIIFVITIAPRGDVYKK